VSYSIIAYLVFLPLMMVFIAWPVYPLSKAFLAGVASVRDPSHRVTPQSPWYFFDPHWQKIRKSAIRRAVILAAIYASIYLVPIIGVIPSEFSDIESWIPLFMMIVNGLASFASYVILAIAFAFRWSPRFTTPGGLTCSAIVGAWFVVMLVGVVLQPVLYALPMAMGSEWGYLMFSGFQFLNSFIRLAVACWVLRWIIRRTRLPGNDAWFRMEE